MTPDGVEGTPAVSILTSVDHDSPNVDAWFAALANQSLGARAEAIVHDSAWNDAYREAYERLPAGGATPIVYLRDERGGRAMGLNRALARARSEILVFCANDFLPGPCFAEMHLEFHRRHPDVEQVGVAPSLIPAEHERGRFTRWLEESGRLFGIPFTDRGFEVPESFFYVGNSSVKRALIERVGGFDESFRHHACDDLDLGLRMTAAGMRSGLVEGAATVHMHPLTIRERCATMREAGEAVRVLEGKHPERGAELAGGARRAPLLLRVAAGLALARYAATRRDRDLFNYYQRRLNASFSAGYRRERSREARTSRALP